MELGSALRVAEVRCRRCDEPEEVGLGGRRQTVGSSKRPIATACSICRAPLCAEHAKALDFMPSEIALLGLTQSSWGEIPVLCGAMACHREALARFARPLNYRLLLAGACLLGLFALLKLVGTAIALYPLLVALVLFGWTGYCWWRSRGALRNYAGDLPLPVRLQRVKVREYLRGSMVVDSQLRYHASHSGVEGIIEARGHYAAEVDEVLSRYRRSAAGAASEHRWLVGHVLLAGRPRVAWPVQQGANQSAAAPLVSVYDSAEDAVRLDMSHEWRWSQRYRVDVTHLTEGLPLSIVPSLAQDGSERVLELEVQWRKPWKMEQPFVAKRVERLELKVPSAWGAVEHISRGATILDVEDGVAQAVRTIVFSKIALSPEAVQARRLRFVLRFERDISNREVVSGKVCVAFQTTFSGISSARVLPPFGLPSDTLDADVQSRVEADFELSLAGLRFQRTLSLPHNAVASDGGGGADPAYPHSVAGQHSVLFRDVPPDEELVAALTFALGARYYVHSVVETYVGRTAGDRVQRVWDLRGRDYRGVYPVDYHISIDGFHGRSATRGPAESAVSIEVQGTYANDEMKGRIEHLWMQLERQVGKVMDSRKLAS